MYEDHQYVYCSANDNDPAEYRGEVCWDIFNVDEKIDGVFWIDDKLVEDLLYNVCVKAINNFSKSEKNKDVYFVCLYFDDQNFNNLIYIVTEADFQKVKEIYKGNYAYTSGKLERLRYSEGDFSYDELNKYDELMCEISNGYSAIFGGQGFDYKPKRNIGFVNTFDRNSISIGINVIKKLVENSGFNVLNKTEDFAAFINGEDVSMEDKALTCSYTVSNKKLVRKIVYYE